MNLVRREFCISFIASRGVTCMIPYRGEGDEVRHLMPSGDVGKVNPMPFHPRDEQSIRDCIGNSDIVLNFVGKYYETKNSDTIKQVESLIDPAEMAFAVTKGNTDLLEKINAGLKNVKDSGKYDELVAKWFSEE